MLCIEMVLISWLPNKRIIQSNSSLGCTLVTTLLGSMLAELY